MKRSAAKLTAGLLALGVAMTASACSTPESPDQTGSSTVVGEDRLAQQVPTIGVVARVLDGATIEVRSGGASFLVRYLGVTIPDGADPEGALQFNRFLAEGKSVRIFKDTVDADTYDIPLRYVYADGEMVNLKLLASGWARLAEFPPSFDFLDEFSRAENSARSGGRGLWEAASHDFDGHAPTATPGTVPEFTGGTLPMAPSSVTSVQCDYSGSADPVIKGNIDRRTGAREYHVPGGLFYSTTVIEISEGERLFSTEGEALSQGWERSKH